MSQQDITERVRPHLQWSITLRIWKESFEPSHCMAKKVWPTSYVTELVKIQGYISDEKVIPTLSATGCHLIAMRPNINLSNFISIKAALTKIFEWIQTNSLHLVKINNTKIWFLRPNINLNNFILIKSAISKIFQWIQTNSVHLVKIIQKSGFCQKLTWPDEKYNWLMN